MIVSWRCLACGRIYPVFGWGIRVCPVCGSHAAMCLGGDVRVDGKGGE